MKIFINPGHGMPDPGACGNGLRECDIVFRIGERVEKYLRAVGIEKKLLQTDSPTRTLNEICDPANDWGADYFISIHCNSFNTYAHGTETFCYSYNSVAEKLANAIQERIIKTIPELTDRGVRTADFAVLRKTNMPAVLVETAFIDNPSDAKILVEHEDDFARAISCGVTDFLSLPKPDLMTCPTCGQAI